MMKCEYHPEVAAEFQCQISKIYLCAACAKAASFQQIYKDEVFLRITDLPVGEVHKEEEIQAQTKAELPPTPELTLPVTAPETEDGSKLLP